MITNVQLSPIYKDNLKKDAVSSIAPQVEIKNLISQVKKDFKDNILFKYDNYTYHIRWFMVPARVQRAREYAYLNSDTTVGLNDKRQYDATESLGYDVEDIYHISDNEKVILLETGVTSQYNLESFNFKTLYSENKLSGYIHMTEMNMTVKEPLGCSMMDKWNVVSRALGWNNQINMPYYIELYFEGYNPETGLPEKITQTFLYKVCIVDVKTSVNHTGTTYTIKMMPYNQYGFQKDNFLAQNIGELGNLSHNTYDAFIKELEDKINKKFFETGENKKLYSEYGSVNHLRYEFVLDSSLVGVKLKDNPTYWSELSAKYKTNPNPNTPLDKIILGAWLQTADNIHDDTEIRIFPKQVIIGYRDDGGQLEKVYYFIVPIRKTFDAQYNKKYSETNAKTYDKFGDYVDYLHQNGLLEKGYEYLFSGKDINVLNFDFKINQMWFLKSPREKLITSKYNEFNIPRDNFGNETFDPKVYGARNIDRTVIQHESNMAFAKIYGVSGYENLLGVKYLDDIEKVIPDEDKVKYLNYRIVPIRTDNDATVDEDNQDDDIKPALRKSALEECHSAGEMSIINFEIVGDPYWLGDDTFDNTLINIRNFVYGNHHITFTVRTPVGQDETTGEVTDYDASHAITGFYIVNQIEHNFSASGKFTQKIKAVLDPMLAIRSDYEDMNNQPSQSIIESYLNPQSNQTTYRTTTQSTQQTTISSITNWDLS